MKRFFRYGLGLMVAGQLAGCYGTYDPREGDTAALNGEPTFPPDANCNSARTSKISLALKALQQHVVTAPTALRACLRNAVFSPDHGAFAEEVLARLAEDMPTTFRCRELGTTPGGSTINAQASGIGTPDESMLLDEDFLDDNDVTRVAAVILHEIAHSKGYTHQGGEEYSYSINEQVERCAQNVIDPRNASPLRRSRAAMKGEVELQRIGGSGGAAFEEFCPGASFVTSVRTTTVSGSGSTAFTAFGLGCRARGSNSTTSRAVFGTASTADSCGADEVVVGLRAYADAGESGDVNRMSFLCARWTDVAAGSTTVSTTLPARGQARGLSVERVCPPGSALKGVMGRGQSGAALHQLRLVCQSLTGVSIGAPNDLSRLGDAVQLGSNRRQVRELCTDTGALVGLYGRADGAINRLGGICAGMRSALGILHPYGVSNADHIYEHILPATGGTGGSEVAARCPNGQVLVGLRAGLGFWGDAISHVAGVCALSHPWSRTSDPVTFTTLGAFGNDRGNGTTLLCPRGELMTGFSMSEATRVDGVRVVENVRPVCRRIDEAPAP